MNRTKNQNVPTVSVGLPYRILNKTGQVVRMLLLATGLKGHSQTNRCFFLFEAYVRK
jgi:hypothetical protein